MCSIVPLQRQAGGAHSKHMYALFCPKVAGKFLDFQVLFEPSPSAESFSVSPKSTRNNCFTHTICSWHFLKSQFLVPKIISQKRIKELYISYVCMQFFSPFQCSQRPFLTFLRGIALRKSNLMFVSVFSKLCFTSCGVIRQYIKSITALDFPYFLLTISSGLMNGPAFL